MERRNKKTVKKFLKVRNNLTQFKKCKMREKILKTWDIKNHRKHMKDLCTIHSW